VIGGVAVDVSGTGTWDVSQIAPSTLAVGYSAGISDAIVGDLNVPAPINVRFGVATGTTGFTGSLVVPSASTVLVGTFFDNGTQGTFDESARNTNPGISHVQTGVGYKIQNVSYTGTLSGGGSGGHVRPLGGE
jgi:hypothetical protein